MKDFFTSEIDSETIKVRPEDSFSKLIREKYEFEACYIPNGFNIALLLIEEDKKDSFKDKWIILFLKEVLDIDKTESGSLTLDNIEEITEEKKRIEIFKETTGTFEDVINVCCDLINKHRENIQETEEQL